MRSRVAVSVTSLLALVESAAASSGHYDSGHLAVFAVVGGAVAIGSSALGDRLASAAKSGEKDPARKAAVAAADYAVKVIADSSPSGEVLRATYDVAKGALTEQDAASGAAEAVTKAATDQLKTAVKAGATEGAAAPAPTMTTPATGTVPKFCRECGTPTREGAQYCASCGRKLV